MSKRLRFVLLLLLSLTSVFLAEVIAGSSKFPLYDAWGILVVIPLYGLHTIILLYIIKKYLGNRKVMFATLYFAGTIFGLYEAYLTKVLWVGLMPDALIFYDIALLDFSVLVFIWHPLMSFIIPALVFEAFMTKDRYLYDGLPDFIKKVLGSVSGRISIFLIIGFFFSLNGIGPVEAFMSGVFNIIPIILLYFFLRKKEIHKKYTLEEILPNNKEIKICAGILLVMYVVMGIFLDGHVLTFRNQAILWVLYLFFGLIFYLKLKGNKSLEEEVVEREEVNFEYMITYVFVTILFGVSVTALWVYGVRDIFMMIVWIIWVLSGIILFVSTLIKKSTN